MIIQSKKTRLQSVVSVDDWKVMKESGDSVHFTVISRDAELEKPEPIQLQAVTEYMARAKESMNKPKKIKSNYKPTKKQDGQ